jgi:hypothetical protein
LSVVSLIRPALSMSGTLAYAPAENEVGVVTELNVGAMNDK